MRRLFLFLMMLVTLTTIQLKAQSYSDIFTTYTPIFSVTQRNLDQVILDDGIYSMKVDYESNTGHKATYVLDVTIRRDNVVRIDFGNGGCVHQGPNNSNYTWYGGGIRWLLDFEGNIQGGLSTIQVNGPDGQWQLFTIRI